VAAITSNYGAFTSGWADGINLVGLTSKQAALQVQCVSTGLEIVRQAFLSKPKPAGVSFNEYNILNRAA